jgi:hypothetical protein
LPALNSLRHLSDEQLLAQCRVEAFRGSGPGGQKRNKTSSAVRLVHEQTGLAAIAGESRSQNINRRRALSRMRNKLSMYIRETVNLSGLPDVRVIEISRRSEQYPAAMGRVLDVLAHAGWSLSESARLIGVSSGKLSAFLAADGPLLAEVNRQRKIKGMRPLHP